MLSVREFKLDVIRKVEGTTRSVVIPADWLRYGNLVGIQHNMLEPVPSTRRVTDSFWRTMAAGRSQFCAVLCNVPATSSLPSLSSLSPPPKSSPIFPSRPARREEPSASIHLYVKRLSQPLLSMWRCQLEPNSRRVQEYPTKGPSSSASGRFCGVANSRKRIYLSS